MSLPMEITCLNFLKSRLKVESFFRTEKIVFTVFWLKET